MVSQKDLQERRDANFRLSRTHAQTDGLIVEPLPELPPLSAGLRRELLKSIRELGILSPLIASGKYIIDGRERHAIALELGLTTIPVKDLGTLDGPGQRREYAIRINAERRHLSPEQRRALLEAFIVAAPSKSSREVADALKVDRSTVDRAKRRLAEGGAIAPPATVEGREGKTYKKLPEPSAPKPVETETVARVPEPEPVQAEPIRVQPIRVRPIKGNVCSNSEVCQLIDETPDDGKPKSVYRVQALAEVIGLTYEEAMDESRKRRKKLPSPPKVEEPPVEDQAAIYITPPKGDPRLFHGAWWRENQTGRLVYITNGDHNQDRTAKGNHLGKYVSYVAYELTKVKALDDAPSGFDLLMEGRSRRACHEKFFEKHTFDLATTLRSMVRDAAEKLDEIDLSRLRGLKWSRPFWARVAVKQAEQLLELGA